MFVATITKVILAALLALRSDPPSNDEELPDGHNEVRLKDQHFCCVKVDLEKWTGEDCVPISEGQIALCNEILYCPGKWGQSDDITKCA